MKKSMIIFSLVASVYSIAGTTGTVEAYNKNETTYAATQGFNDSFKATKSTIGVKTEVKVKDTGLSFGADVKVKDYTIFATANTLNKVLGNVKDNSSVWAKYDLPEMNNINSYVKAKYETKGKINVEGDLSYKLAEKLSAGLNSNTTFDFTDKKKGLTSDKVTSVHKAYLKGEYGNVKDIYAELGFQHSYEEPATSVKNVFLNAKASYMPMEDLTLTGKVDFKHTFNDTRDSKIMKDDSLLGIELPSIFPDLSSKTLSDINIATHIPPKALPGFNVETALGKGPISDFLPGGKLVGKYRHSYLLTAKYTGIKDTELKLDSFIEHNYVNEYYTVLNFGFKPEITYKGIPNLVLSSKNVLGGTTNYLFHKGKSLVNTAGYIKLNANAEYTYNVTEKLNVKPSLDLTAKVLTHKAVPVIFSTLEITPKLAIEYKPINDLTLSANLAPVFTFGKLVEDDFNYLGTNVKTNFNIKYTW